MSEPVAIAKAESLERHRAYLGAPPTDFVVPLTLAEAKELAIWFTHQVGYDAEFLRALHRRKDEPFRVFDEFDVRLVGFAVVSLQ